MVETSTAAMAPHRRIDSVQALRFVAALLVVFYHLPKPGGDGQGPTLATMGHWGGYGVDVFFVISGFIIAYSATRRDAFSAAAFLRDRVDRIYPVYWVVLLATVAISLLQSNLGMANATADLLTPLGYLTSILLLPLPHQIIPVAWTLGMEMTFYLLFALGFRFGGLRGAAVLVAAWYATAVAHARADAPWQDGTFVFLLHSISLEFLFGMGIATLHARGRMPAGGLALAAGLALTLLIMPEWAALPAIDLPREIRAGIPAALIVYGTVALAFRTPRWLVLGGEASYALYLTHTLVLAIVGKATAGVLGIPLGSSVLLQIGAVLASIAASLVVLVLVERPLRGLLRPGPWRPRWPLRPA
ncbi:acyltransferase [Jannaschia sp. LMIT008]|uniref:acyltransferase family protein n=1 Tax=Jannaschia maritima TaxID=3032585 RepID=UPI002811C112|nr:acyltransferase [Jannaschia sp. LMIT008]